MVTKTIDNRRVLRHRIDLWRHAQFDTLIFEFLRCSKLWIKSRATKTNSEHKLKVFSNLMFKGQLRAAVRWITERMDPGGVLHPSQSVNDSAQTVLDVL